MHLLLPPLPHFPFPLPPTLNPAPWLLSFSGRIPSSSCCLTEGCDVGTTTRGHYNTPASWPDGDVIWGGGTWSAKKGEKDKVSHMEKEQRAHTAVGKEKGHTENPGKKRIKERHLKDYGLYSCWSEVNRAQRKSVKMASTIKVWFKVQVVDKTRIWKRDELYTHFLNNIQPLIMYWYSQLHAN